MKHLITIFVLLFFTLNVCGQYILTSGLKGYIRDSATTTRLSGATVNCLRAKDSSKINITFTDKNGAFLIDNIPSGDYLLYITYMGYKPLLSRKPIHVSGQIVNLGNIDIQKTGLTLTEVEIVHTGAPWKIKKDTIEFNARSIKIRENASIEELLKKIPGVSINEDGQITVNGETVKYILINGRPVFMNDPGMVTRNLLAELVDKIQLIDQKPDELSQAGEIDTRKQKTINITIKEEKQNKVTGQLTVGGGTQNKYALKSNASRFKSDQQLIFIGNGNNTNGYQEGSTNIPAGNIRNWNVGINYSEDWSKKFTFNGSYSLNDNYLKNESSSIRQNFQEEGNYYNDQKNTIGNWMHQHTISSKLDYKVDSFTLLSLKSDLNYTQNKTTSDNDYKSYSNTQSLINIGDMHNKNNSGFINASESFNLIKKFKKPNRKLSANIYLNNNNNNGSAYNESNNSYALSNGALATDTINQKNKITNTVQTAQLGIYYTEPLTKYFSLEFQYLYTNSLTKFGRSTYDYDIKEDTYDLLNDSLTNEYKSTSVTHYTSIGVTKQKEKYDYSISLYSFINDIKNINFSHPYHINTHTAALAPQLDFNYYLSNHSRLLLLYREGIIIPNINQLQLVPDNSNSLFIQKGNPNLKSPKTNNFTIVYSQYNSTNAYNMNINITGVIFKNKIIDNTYQDSIGRQISEPTNKNGAYNISTTIENNININKQNFSLRSVTNLSFDHDVNIIDNIDGNIDNRMIDQMIKLNFRSKELLDCSLSAEVRYNNIIYRLQTNSYSELLMYHLFFDGILNLPANYTFISNITYVINNTQAIQSSNSGLLLNASISKAILKKHAILKLQGFDLLNKNLSIHQNVGSNYIETSHNMVMQRFFMISFSYLLKGR
ncbi:outer membrane beta-barrel protein [Chitinophaga sp. 30R24]|uniref:outer membrane beta-barrel protein n=1 Tax=Chitinophaga sp. 30R24 TaxID=3248838 RepID=UPI003B904168